MNKQELIKEASKNAMSYTQYRDLVGEMVVAQSNTGKEKTDALAQYTLLNNQRMKRLDRTGKVLPDNVSFLEGFSENIYFLIITESWCGDAAQTMPMINKIAVTAGIPIKIVLRDKHLDLMDQFLTDGNRAIAKLIVVNASSHEPITTWGPRPTAAKELVELEKKNKGSLSPAFKEELQIWYNKDKGKSTEADMITLLKTL